MLTPAIPLKKPEKAQVDSEVFLMPAESQETINHLLFLAMMNYI
jgi:hypothetical protein